ncbi:MAG TPA: amidohydrolase family protein [Bacteroidia bacterium]|nr:amidohydrolase family protein [Bacteroidia bacterium]
MKNKTKDMRTRMTRGRHCLVFALTLALSLKLYSQEVPRPAPAHKGNLLLENATIHVGNGTLIVRGNILIKDDKIVAVGVTDFLPQELRRIDLAGKHVYPGLIAPVTHLGLSEVEAARATNDRTEVGSINPNIRAIIGYNADSRVTPTLRSNGILLAQVTPEGDLLRGLSAVVQLDAWGWEDAAYQADDALQVNWPSQQISNSPFAPPREEQEKRIRERMGQLEGAMRDARAYSEAKAAGKLVKTDLRWEAMLPILDGTKAVWITANSEKDIRTALEFSLRHKLRMVLVGGADAWLLSDLLRQYEIPVVLQKTQRLPRTEDDPVDQPFRAPMILHNAGLLTCISMDSYWNYRNLPFQAGQAVAAGLDKEAALQLITLNTAKILGIDKRTGSIEVGKDANLIVSTGDLLDMRTSKVELALIQGRQIDLNNKQSDLNRKYLDHYGK